MHLGCGPRFCISLKLPGCCSWALDFSLGRRAPPPHLGKRNLHIAQVALSPWVQWTTGGHCTLCSAWQIQGGPLGPLRNSVIEKLLELCITSPSRTDGPWNPTSAGLLEPAFLKGMWGYRGVGARQAAVVSQLMLSGACLFQSHRPFRSLCPAPGLPHTSARLLAWP